MDERRRQRKQRRLKDNIRHHHAEDFALQCLKHAELQSPGRRKLEEDAVVLHAACADDSSPPEGQKVSVTEVEQEELGQLDLFSPLSTLDGPDG